MKEKTKERLEKRWLNLPLHHVDTCIILEAMLKGRYQDVCSSYMGRLEHKYKGVFSILTLGELLRRILLTLKITQTQEGETTKQDAFSLLDWIIERKNIKFYSPQFRAYQIINAIKKMESRIEPADALNLACAVEDKADVFVTLDKTMLGSKQLEKEFKIKIKHPSEL